jgi:hypothetical protein
MSWEDTVQTCPRCGELNPPGGNVCQFCNSPLLVPPLILDSPTAAEAGLLGREAREGSDLQRHGAAVMWIGAGLFAMGLTFVEGAGTYGGDPALGVAGVVSVIAGVVLMVLGFSVVRKWPVESPETGDI